MGSLRGCPAQLYVTGPVQPNYFQWACRGWPAQLYVTGAVQPINMCHRFVTVYVHILCMCACIHKVKPFQIVQKKSIENAFKNQSNFLSKINRKWFLQEISSIDFSFENWKSIEDWFWKKINRKIDFFQSRSLWDDSLGPLLEVQMSKKCTLLWREARFQVKMLKAPGSRTTFGGSDVASLRFITLHYITLHYIPLHYITLHYIPQHYKYNYTTTQLHNYTTTQLHNYIALHSTTLNYTPLHSTTLNYTTVHYSPLHYITLHYTPLHSSTLNYTTLHYTTLHYIPLHSTTLQLQLHNYTPLHSSTAHYTTLHYATLHYTTLHYTTLPSTTLHYITLHYIPLDR